MIDGEGEMGETNIDGQQRGPRFICIERDLLHQPPATLSLTLCLCSAGIPSSCLASSSAGPWIGRLHMGGCQRGCSRFSSHVVRRGLRLLKRGRGRLRRGDMRPEAAASGSADGRSSVIPPWLRSGRAVVAARRRQLLFRNAFGPLSQTQPLAFPLPSPGLTTA